MSRATTRYVPPAPTKWAFPAIVVFSYLTAHSREPAYLALCMPY